VAGIDTDMDVKRARTHPISGARDYHADHDLLAGPESGGRTTRSTTRSGRLAGTPSSSQYAFSGERII